MFVTGVKFHEWVYLGGWLMFALAVGSAWQAKALEHLFYSFLIAVFGLVLLKVSFVIERHQKRTKKPVE